MANDIKPLYGYDRRAAELKITAWVIYKILGERKRLGFKARRLLKFLKKQAILTSGLKASKYIEFNGKIFQDVFAPHWPSPGLERMVETLAVNTDRLPGERRDFMEYVVVAITSRCMYRCKHCYTIHTLQNKDALPLEKLLEVIGKLLDIGVGVLSLEGGEPLLRYDDLITLVKAAHGRANPWIATTGFSLTKEKAVELADAGLVGAQISLDHYNPDKHNDFRGNKKAFDSAVNAVRFFREAGVFPAIAVVAGKEMLKDGGLYKYLEFAKETGAGIIQLLDPIPSGRYTDSEGEILFNDEERKKIADFHVEVNREERFRDYPGISARIYIEDDCRYGCGMGGNQTCYVDGSGNVEPCAFMNISMGNVMEEDFDVIFRRMRKLFPRPVGGFCPAFEISDDLKRARLAEPILERIAKRPLPGIFRKTEEG